jgi:glyoxylase-like metal-dependent hydrolase (beta-lactamase superfamily II)
MSKHAQEWLTRRGWDHVAVLYEDRSDPNGPHQGGPDGKLDGFDVIVHMGHPRLEVEPLERQTPARVDVPLPRDSAAAFPVLSYELLYPLAPGVVLIKAPGHTAGSQYVYVQLASGKEVLLLADLAWQHEGLETDRQRPEATSRSLAEDREALQPQLEWARKIWQGGAVAIVLSHDSRLLDSLVTAGVLVNDFDLRLP